MSTNKYQPHLLVIPEDDANRQIMTGFRNHPGVDSRRIHIEPVAGGWREALDVFSSEHTAAMKNLPRRHVLLLIDFDGQTESRRTYAEDNIPHDLRGKVFVIGSATEPERLRSTTGKSYETIGRELADACLSDSETLWDSALLRHNINELTRMKSTICPHLGESQ